MLSDTYSGASIDFKVDDLGDLSFNLANVGDLLLTTGDFVFTIGDFVITGDLLLAFDIGDLIGRDLLAFDIGDLLWLIDPLFLL